MVSNMTRKSASKRVVTERELLKVQGRVLKWTDALVGIGTSVRIDCKDGCKFVGVVAPDLPSLRATCKLLFDAWQFMPSKCRKVSIFEAPLKHQRKRPSLRSKRGGSVK